MENRISDPWTMVENNLGIVAIVINTLVEVDEGRVGFEYADLYQEGCLWLYQAALTFDASRGIKFGTYAYKVVTNGIKMYCRRLKRKNRFTVLPFEELDFSENQSIIFISSEELLHEYVAMTDILDWLERLKSEYKGVTKLGIEAIQWKVKGLNGSDIAKIYGVKSNHIGAWISRAVKKIRDNPVFNLYIEELLRRN